MLSFPICRKSSSLALLAAMALSAPGIAQAASMPSVGQYGCSSAPAVIAAGGAYKNTVIQLGQWMGDIWVLNDHQYAGPYHKDDVGNYKMEGDKLVATSGSYAPPRNRTEILYAPANGKHEDALHIEFIEADGKPSIGLWCIHKK